MTTVEQQDLPCKVSCRFIQDGLRPCGLGYVGRKVKRWKM